MRVAGYRRGVRPLLFVVVATLLVAWCVLGVVGAVDVLGTSCAGASSEVSDPCAIGKTTSVVLGFLAWCVVALPLGWALGALRPSNESA